MSAFAQTGQYTPHPSTRSVSPLSFSDLECQEISPAGASPLSPSEQTVTFHLTHAAAPRALNGLRPAAPALVTRPVHAAPGFTLGQALSRASEALATLGLCQREASRQAPHRAWIEQAHTRLQAFLALAQSAEDAALLGGLESVPQREQRADTLHKLGPRLQSAFESLNDCLRATPAALRGQSGLAPDGLRQACRVIAARRLEQVALRSDFLQSSECHHVFYLPRMLASKALYWEAAAAVLESLAPAQPLAARQVATPLRPTDTPRSHAQTLRTQTPVRVAWGDAQTPVRPDRLPKPQPQAAALLPEGKHSPSRMRSPASLASTASPSQASSLRTSSPSDRFASPISRSLAQASPSSTSILATPSSATAARAASRPGLSRGAAGSVAEKPSDKQSEKRPQPTRDLVAPFARRAAQLREQSAAAAADDSENRLADPGQVLGLQRKAGRAPVAAAVKAVLAGENPPCFDDALIPERDFVQACLKAAVSRLRQASPAANWPSDAVLEARFQQAISEALRRRPNEVVRSQLLLPVAEAVPALGRRVLRPLQAQCEQRPAVAVTQALAQAYAADGVQGAHCHERSQHKHATNLYLSRFSSGSLALPGQAPGQPLLTLTRHGVLSPLALSVAGLRSEFRPGAPQADESLGRAALDLAADVGDARLIELQQQVQAGQVPAQEAWVQAARHVRADADRGFIERLRPTRPLLIDRMRAAGALRRAREAAEVAMSSLPDTVLADIAIRAAQGLEPRVRLASISLMTPDHWRRIKGSVSDNEHAMWTDQRQAWAQLGQAPCDMPLPYLRDGQVRRDAQGRLVIATDTRGQPLRVKVRFEPLAMNVPVNKQATERWSAGGFDVSDASNQQALTTLLGENWALLPPQALDAGDLHGWVGEALRGEHDPQRRAALVALSQDVIRIYREGAHRSAGTDPYKLAKRLIVLCNLLPGTATLINCKSGKDRTSEAEAQARHLAMEIALRGGQPPAYTEPSTPLRQAQLGVLHESGGAREIQYWNTNIAGTKSAYAAVLNQYGKKSDIKAVYKGAAALIHS